METPPNCCSETVKNIGNCYKRADNGSSSSENTDHGTRHLYEEPFGPCHCEEQIVGQASCLSIMDDGQDARPTGNLSGFIKKRLLRFARNDNLFSARTQILSRGVCGENTGYKRRQLISEIHAF